MKGKIISAIVMTACAVQAQAAEYSTADLCKAAISVEMGRDTKTMKTKKAGDVPEIFYFRADDGQKFSYRCMLEGNRIVWSAYFPEERQWGRWRNAEEDARITYSVANGTLHIESDQADQMSFTHGDFGR